MADTRPGADPRKTGVGEYGNFLAPLQMFEGRSHLVNFFHSGAKRSTANQHDYIPRHNSFWTMTLNSSNRLTLAGKDTGAAYLTIYAVAIHHTGINRGAF